MYRIYHKIKKRQILVLHSQDFITIVKFILNHINKDLSEHFIMEDDRYMNLVEIYKRMLSMNRMDKEKKRNAELKKLETRLNEIETEREEEKKKLLK